TVMSLGCAAGTDGGPGGDDTGATSEAQIVALGAPIISGCNVSQVFSISAPSFSNIGFVALSSQNMNNTNAQLFTTNQAGQQVAVNSTAQQTSQAMQSMLNQALSSSTLAANQNSSIASN